MSDEGKIVDSNEMLADILQRMFDEGDNGLIVAEALTAMDAVKMLLKSALGASTPKDRMNFIECDQFLTSLEKTQPLCAAEGCSNPMHTEGDVGVIVVLHGMCEEPSAVLASGICQTCFIERFECDKEKAVDGFTAFLRVNLPGMISFNLATISAEATEMNVAANAPSSRTVN